MSQDQHPEKKRGRPQKEAGGLTADRIVANAKRMMQSSKKVPSIRGLANELNVDAMALYYYFKNKNALLEAVTTSLVAEVYQPEGNVHWRAELTALCKSYLMILSRYDGLLQTLLTMQSTSPADVFIGRFQQIIAPLSLPEAREKAFLDLLVDYLHGFAIAWSCDQSGRLSIEHINAPLELLLQSIE